MVQEITDFREGEKKLLLQILKAVRDIRYASVQIVVQDPRVVQIDKTEKIRLDGESFY